MPQQYHQAGQQGVWMVAGPPQSAALQLGQALSITFADGTTASLSAHVPAITSTSATQVDRTAAVWVAYVVKGETTLRLAKESDLPTLVCDYAPLARLLIDRVVPYQPDSSLGTGSLVPGLVSTTTTLLSSTSALALSLWNGTTNNAPPTNWQSSGFADGSWSAATSATIVPTSPASTGVSGSALIWPGAAPAATTEQALFRHHFVLPAGTVSSASVQLGWDDFLDAIYVNGTALSGVPTAQDNDWSGATVLGVPASALAAGASNVLAIAARNSGPNNAWISYKLSVVTAAGGAEGDILYLHGGAWTRLPIGTSGQELTVVGGDPAWTAQPIASAGTLGEIKVGSGLWVAGDGTLSAAGSGYTDPLTTEGDLPYRHSGATTRLGVGPAGTALLSNGTDPSYDDVVNARTRWEPLTNPSVPDLLFDANGDVIMTVRST